MRSKTLVLTFLFTLAGCGPTQVEDCRANCSGCCTADGMCEFGSAPSACGNQGTQCVQCFAGQTCQLGVCVSAPVTCTNCPAMDSGLPETDAGADAGTEDAGTDAGTEDAGTMEQDAGTDLDSGVPFDAGMDAGVDAGMQPIDAGVCASGDSCTASYGNGGCCAAYPACRGTTTSSLLKCRASCGGATVACTSSDDCCSGLSCQGGTCQVAPADAGTPVDAGTMMDGGAVITSCVGFSCATFNECCSSASYCRGATAGAPTTCQRTPGSSGQRCIDSGDCASGLLCNSAVCGVPACRGSGVACTDGSQCCSNTPYCTGSIFSPATKCSATPGPQGAPCIDINDCAAPNSCVQGFCQEVDFNCRMLHQSCQSAFACCSGVSSGPGELWCAPGGSCYPLACGGPNDLCPGGAENSGCCSGLVCFGGLCKPPQTVQCDAAGEACLLDTCCSGLFCNAHSGFCEVPQTGCGQLYSSCTSSSQCCTSTGLFCNNGICDYGTACKITGQSCAGGEPCCSGLTCSSGSCQPSSTCRLSGSSCSATSPCCSGLTCTGGTCQTQTSCRSSGQTCGGGTQCCNQLSCTNGVCQSAPTCGASGTSCSSSSECCSSAHFCRGSSATSANACTATCAPNGVKAASQGDCCAGLSIDASGVCRSAPSCLSSGASCLSSATPCCSSAPYCRAGTATGSPSCSATCAGDGMRAKSAADCCAGTNFDGSVCRAPPTCKPSGQTCNGASECCANVPYCGASTTNQFWSCRSSCVPRGGSASSTNDCCAGLVKNSLGWCDTPCGGPGTSCNNNGACCSLSCNPTQFVCN